MDEGYIKFTCNWIPSNSIRLNIVAELNAWREGMYKKGMTGVYPEGIGFGNIGFGKGFDEKGSNLIATL